MSEELVTPVDKKVFYNYWRTLPVVRTVPGEDHQKIYEQPIRGYILNLLREGIEEIDPNTTLKVKRHVLSARELYTEIKRKLTAGIPCTLSNIYFHLSVLEEDPGYVKEVLTIKNGKQKIKYFGRTAKLFLYKDKDITKDQAKMATIISELSIIIHQLKPNMTKEEIESFLKKYSDKRIETIYNSSDLVTQWIAKHEAILSEHNIDIRDLHELLANIFFDKIYTTHNIDEIINFFDSS